MGAFYKFLGTYSTSVFAEVAAVLEGLRFAKSFGITHVWIELDSQVLVTILNDQVKGPWNICLYFAQYTLSSAKDTI